jgi:luciferase family oxidoreductase group 1
MLQLSILDLVRVRQGSTPQQAIHRSREMAIHAEALGYHRVWFAEHHNFRGIASAATSLIVGYVAEATRTIRVGAGGIMLPNHSPYVIAEQFGTLAHLYPGRIDLGLGRAPGTDQQTWRGALRRSPSASDSFPQDVRELQAYFSDEASGQKIEAVPAAKTNVPLWILGSSTFGAALAAELGLPYSFASHFAPAQLIPALEIYHRYFKPSKQLAAPYTMVAVNVVAAETDAKAKVLATTQQMGFTDLIRGAPSLSKPPIADIETYWTPTEKAHAQGMLAQSIIGSPDTVLKGFKRLIKETAANEYIISSDIFEMAEQKKSHELIAMVAKSL